MTQDQLGFNQTVVGLFELQVQETPNLIAVQDKHIAYSYQELNEKANQYAHWLVKKNIKQGEFVAILLEPSVEFIVCILAIIKVGAIYVPLDTRAPQTRLKTITNDFNPKLIITSENYKIRLKNKVNISLIKNIQLECIRYDKLNLDRAINPSSPIYLMYTSGSTGKPKGILIPHQAVVNLTKVDNYANITKGTIIGQFSNLAFDACTFEIWSALLNGAVLSIIPLSARTDHIELKKHLQKQQITCLFLPTGYFHQLIKSFPKTLNAVEIIVIGGEQANAALIKNFLHYRKMNQLPLILINGYGPTEATTFTCRHIMTEESDFDDEELMSIGRPIRNVETYVLDEYGNRATEGELYISGINLALGYFSNENKEHNAFSINPFEQNEPYKRLYKTGDRVKYLPSGKLFCLGRLDDQVKVGGFRIHLSEIENELMKHEAISLAAVVVEIGGGAHKMLTAYLVLSSQRTLIHANDLRAFLSLHLPSYMLPSKYVVVDELPLTLVGKVDKKNLDKLPHTDLYFHIDTSSSSAIEEAVKKIWEHLLNRSNIDIHRNLFELGANSLLMLEACARINEELKTDLQITQMVTHPTISRLSRFIEGDIDVLAEQKHPVADFSEIAIIGMSCRFPKADSVEEFWENLCQSKVCLERFTEEQITQKPHVVPVRGILSNIEEFDANFFGFSPMDASIADPQQRLFLECVWEALERAAVVPSQVGNKISVFAGAADSTYLHENLQKNSWVQQELDRFHQRIATSLGMLSTQVSYRLNLKGRSLNVNTACSTGLVAVAQACQELMTRTSDIALAGAISIVVPQKEGYVYKQGGIESADGCCRPFESRADGTVFSNGVGVVVLKRLEDALADNDTIFAVIKGVGINNDGSDKLGYTAPSVNGQIECIREALLHSKVKAKEIGYIEAHGTATSLGDAVEVEALSTVFREQTSKKQYCALGSVKGNIGHTDVASGIAGLMKAALCLFHKKIPPMPNFEQYNPHIQFEESPFFVNSQLIEWRKESTHPLYAGVSSFGVGGTNVHMILSEHVSTPVHLDEVSESLVVLSAKTEKALQQNIEKMTNFLSNSEDNVSLADIAYTLQTGRETFEWRCFCVGKTREEVIKNLPLSPISCCDMAIHPSIVFMFPGQGMQYPQMAAELMLKIPFFSSLVQRGIAIAKSYLDIDLLEIINNPSDARLNQTQYAQPALFIIEYALAHLLIHYGITPSAVIGHSLGEYVAACIAGVFSFEEAIALVCQRGFLMASAPAGEMLAIECTREELSSYLEYTELALHNSTTHFVVAGKAAEINQLEKILLEAEKPFRKLKVNHSFHSQSMEGIEQPLKDLFVNFTLSAPQIPMISNVTGTWLSAKEAMDPHYWYTHLRHTVQFCKGIETLLEDSHPLFLEVGPGQSLNVFLKDIASSHKKEVVSTSTLMANYALKSEFNQLIAAIGMVWQQGIRINWLTFHEEASRRHTPLPTYAFQKQKYWIDPDVKTKRLDNKPTFYKPIWSQQLVCPFELSDTTTKSLQDNTWIIFKDKLGIADQVITFLKKKNTSPIVIEMGELYFEEKSRYFKINPANKDHYKKLFSALRDKLRNPIVLHCFTCANTGDGMLSYKEIDAQLELGFFSILYLAQSYLECIGDQTVLKTLILSTGTQQVVGSENVSPINAGLIGPCRVLSKEHSFMQCKLLDITLNDPLFSSQNFLSLLFGVCLNEAWNASHSVVAYRNNYRWDLTYELAKSYSSAFRFKDNGTYLITGGLGGIVLMLCEAITKSIKKPRFILLSRSAMIPEEEWDSALQDPSHVFHQKISHLKKMQILGAQFIFHQVDVTDFESLSLIINHYTSAEKIHGVIHGAGVAGGGLMVLKSKKEAQEILLPKIHGTYNLAKIFQDYPLDFVVLLSSIAAITGEPGQIDYCAANACLDAFAVSKLFSSSFVLSINWNTWRDIGMAVDAARIYKENFLNRGNDISSAQGQQLFLQAMQRQDANLIISNFDIDYYSTKDNGKIVEEKHALPKTSRQNVKTSVAYVPPNNAIENQLAGLWQESLGIEQIGINDDFFVLGGHSLKAINLIEKINKNFNCNLPATQIYHDPTIKQLCKTILKTTENRLSYTPILLKKGEEHFPYLFLGHPISGLMNCYQSLVSQSELPMSIYGIQDPSIEANELVYNSLAAMVDDYFSMIRKIQPTGPYFLLGYSFGGNILFEIASKLLKQGEKVNLLALIDSWAIKSPALKNETYFKLYFKEASGLSDEITNLAWKREQLSLAHSISKLDHEMLLFKASYLSDIYRTIDDPTNGWAKYNKGKIICHALEGNHDTVMNANNSKIILQLIEQYLKERYGIANEVL